MPGTMAVRSWARAGDTKAAINVAAPRLIEIRVTGAALSDRSLFTVRVQAVQHWAEAGSGG